MNLLTYPPAAVACCCMHLSCCCLVRCLSSQSRGSPHPWVLLWEALERHFMASRFMWARVTLLKVPAAGNPLPQQLQPVEVVMCNLVTHTNRSDHLHPRRTSLRLQARGCRYCDLTAVQWTRTEQRTYCHLQCYLMHLLLLDLVLLFSPTHH